MGLLIVRYAAVPLIKFLEVIKYDSKNSTDDYLSG
jgi:hypothetical protein